MMASHSAKQQGGLAEKLKKGAISQADVALFKSEVELLRAPVPSVNAADFGIGGGGAAQASPSQAKPAAHATVAPPTREQERHRFQAPNGLPISLWLLLVLLAMLALTAGTLAYAATSSILVSLIAAVAVPTTLILAAVNYYSAPRGPRPGPADSGSPLDPPPPPAPDGTILKPTPAYTPAATSGAGSTATASSRTLEEVLNEQFPDDALVTRLSSTTR